MMEEILDEEQLEQLRPTLSSLPRKVELRITLDDSDQSEQLRGLTEQLVEASDGRITVREGEAEDTEDPIPDPRAALPHAMPIVRVYAQDDSGAMSNTGIAFHGVPAARQLVALLSGILDAAGGGGRVDPEDFSRIQSLQDPVDILLLVSLTCPYCQATVEACDRLATLTDKVRAEAYDVNLYPELSDEYQADGVPVIVVSAGQQEPLMAVGARDVDGILDLIEQAYE